MDGKLFFSLWKSAKSIGIFSALVVLNGAVQAEQEAARAQPFQATRAVEAHTASTPQTIAMKQRVDRMEILVHERNEILSKLNNFDARGDKAALAQIQEDLKSIDLEIALVSGQPIYPTSGVTSSDDGAKQVSSSQTENKESQPKESEKVTYERWDIFKNFGSKGNE
ncbi:hypothetical protein LPH44_11945 (plasmid) [Xylella taiwanensis]|uniref:Uncharacterized protein n=2 Tax=Xylella taiwanensis TaxID=1444770 RepID=A0ABS8U048_9GAMM|nr:hypothetical protein [Xylella taiwanensis]MCD8459778.1 hypothetical protein [Xylella taiwanensis]MCD8474167.1 hypothetical protein [Xylella taiwanensis]UFN08047.1 hypothetical protein LPH42_11965 [Xylella taiwanensis]UFN12628.1 hypothetical protein LPH44_11945 [Xylella taiwanensis]UFN14921.1 hypothetical protein LPH61_11965 [Xylella taiwanensis]